MITYTEAEGDLVDDAVADIVKAWATWAASRCWGDRGGSAGLKIPITITALVSAFLVFYLLFVCTNFGNYWYIQSKERFLNAICISFICIFCISLA
jgi:hypothetical protein